jgi:Na+/H+ antiporter NhaD/arsenite permease-like protein
MIATSFFDRWFCSLVWRKIDYYLCHPDYEQGQRKVSKRTAEQAIKEKALLVFASTVIGALLILFLAGEIVSPH